MSQLKIKIFLLVAILPAMFLTARDVPAAHRPAVNQDARHYHPGAGYGGYGGGGTVVSPTPPPSGQPGMDDDSDALYRSYQQGNPNR